MIRVNVNVKQLSHVIYRLGHFSDHWMSLVCHSYFNPTSNPHLFHRPSDSCLKQKLFDWLKQIVQPIKKPVRTLSIFMSMAFVKDEMGFLSKTDLKDI